MISPLLPRMPLKPEPTPVSAQVTITFAAAFPNNIWTAWISQIGTGGASAQWQVSNATASGFTITSWDVGTTRSRVFRCRSTGTRWEHDRGCAQDAP